DPEGVIELLADPAVRIISLTITEGGYNLRDSDAGFDTDNPAVQRDLTGDGPPATVFGLVAAGLPRRRERGLPSPTILSCDNIVETVCVACRGFNSCAELADPGLAQWMRERPRWPNSMVGRITPVTAPEVIYTRATDFDVEDPWPVVAEPFC